jgi:hypothetical protein
VTPFDLLRLDRLVEALAVKLRAFRLAGLSGDAPAIEREASSLSTYEDLRAITTDPLAPRLALHVAALTLDRVTLADEARVALLRRKPAENASAHGATVAQLARLLLDPTGDRGKRLTDLSSISAGVRDAQRLFAERRREAARRLRLRDETDVDHAPLTPPGAVPLAEAVLRATEPAFAEMRDRPLVGMLDVAVASAAGDGWPAKITARWVREVFRGPLFDGVAVDLGGLPDAVGAASFARVLARAGRELAFRDRPAGVPYTLVRDPFDLLEARRGALFAGLVLEPRFHQKKLGLGPARAKEQARVVARASVVWIRLAALRALVAAGMATGGSIDDYPDLSERCLGRPLSRELAGVFPHVGPRSALDLAAVLAAARDRAIYREGFDDDWFDNPRAHEALRHEHHAARPAAKNEPSTLATEGDLERALAEALA